MASGSGGGLSQTSRSPCACTMARALPGFDSRWNTREAWAYMTGSADTVSYDGRRTTVLSCFSLAMARRSSRLMMRIGLMTSGAACALSVAQLFLSSLAIA
jgi:hypothetical protein